MLLQDLSPGEAGAFVEANAAAVREHLPADLLLVNHVLLGAPVGVAAGMPFSVKAHGSELEFSIRGNGGLATWARESLDRAGAVYAGSGASTGTRVGCGAGRVHRAGAGRAARVDVDELARARGRGLAGLLAESRRDPSNPNRERERLPDPGNAERLAEFLAGDEPTVVYVGKLSAEKGADLLLAALGDVDARTVMVGFGPLRDELEEAARGRGVLFTGPLEHRHLRHLWAFADVSVTPSVFPEAFGMVAAEAAACGSPPLVARHSGARESRESRWSTRRTSTTRELPPERPGRPSGEAAARSPCRK